MICDISAAGLRNSKYMHQLVLITSGRWRDDDVSCEEVMQRITQTVTSQNDWGPLDILILWALT